MSVRLRYFIYGLMVGRTPAARARAREETRAIEHLPDRRALTDLYIPELAKRGSRILWIGVRPYTGEVYDTLASGGAQVWSLDIDRTVAPWGAPGRHRTGDVRALDRLFGPAAFDVVIFSGVLGYGVDTVPDASQAFAAIHSVLEPGGLLLLGWNTDSMVDPVQGELTAPLYRPAQEGVLPTRLTFEASTHVYDLLRRDEARSSGRPPDMD